MQVDELKVPGAWSFTPKQWPDPRGVFLEWFKGPVLEEALGHPFALKQANHSVSSRGTLRGVHFADVPPGQAKYVYCTRGAVLDVVVDVPRRRVHVGDRSVELTATEFALLETLARQPRRVFTRSQLLDAIHGVAFESYERAIDAHIKNIRRKLEPDPRSPRYILTVYGVGYRLADR